MSGEPHNAAQCPKAHGCCGWLIEIVQTELHILQNMGIDPLEYSQKDKNITKNFYHDLNGVEGPYWMITKKKQ